MFRGTTPTIIIDVEGENFSNAISMEVDIRQEEVLIKKVDAEVTVVPDNDDAEVSCTLSQDETLSLRPGDVYVQIRWTESSNLAFASPVAQTSIKDILREGSI